MHLVIIGNGVAGINAARHVRILDPDAYITVVSDESDHFYSRTALMYIYMGHMTYEHTKPYEDRFWEENGLKLVRDHAVRVDSENRIVYLRSGGSLDYDKLLVATGSRWRRGGWPGETLRGVRGLYGLPDLEMMEADTRNIKRAVVVGGGLIGVEMAEMLHSRGIRVTFLVREPTYMGLVLPAEESEMVNREIRRHGIDLRLGVELKEILDDGHSRARAVVTSEDEELEAQFVGVTIGVQPNIEFLEGSGVETDRGVLVNEMLETNIEGVFAAGDCAQHRDPPPERRPVEQLWYTGRIQGAAVAHTICERRRVYTPGLFFNSAKFFDLEYQVYGRIDPDLPDGEDAFYWEHENGQHAVRIQYRRSDRVVVGFNLMGVRYRQVVCERWIDEGTALEDVMADLGTANFDPEFFRQHEPAIITAYNAQCPGTAVKLKRKKGWRRWMSPDPRGLTGTDIPPGRALP